MRIFVLPTDLVVRVINGINPLLYIMFKNSPVNGCVSWEKIYIVVPHDIGIFSFLFDGTHNLVQLFIKCLHISVWWFIQNTNNHICS